MLLTLVGGLYVVERYGGGLPGEEALWRRNHGWQRPHFTYDLATFFGSLATPVVAGLTVGVLALLVGRRRGSRAALFVVATAGVVLVNIVLKAAIGITPPFHDLGYPYGVGGNFPSGHVSYATAVFGGVAWLAWTGRQRDMAFVAALLVPVMGGERIVSGAHLLSDVLAGYALGGAWLLGAIVLVRPAPARLR